MGRPTFRKYSAKTREEAAYPSRQKANRPGARVIKKDKNEKDRYFVSRTDQEYKYVDELNMLFPRMYSSDPRHVQAYKEWAQGKRPTGEI